MQVTTDPETGRLQVEDGTGLVYKFEAPSVAEHVERIRRAQDAYAEKLDGLVKSIGTVEIPPMRTPIPVRLHAFADWVARDGHSTCAAELKDRACALIDGRPFTPRPEGLPWPEPPKGLPPLVKKLMRVMRLHYDGTLTDQTVATALREVLDEHQPKEPVPVVERTLCCGTCRREFCRVQAPVDALVVPVCTGCMLEGRA